MYGVALVYIYIMYWLQGHLSSAVIDYSQNPVPELDYCQNPVQNPELPLKSSPE
jgi:hypothetical protein